MTNAASSSGDPKMITGLFRDSESVERAYEVISQRGYDTGDINVVMSDDTRKRYFSDDRHINTKFRPPDLSDFAMRPLHRLDAGRCLEKVSRSC